uniref:Zinc finger RNA-binding protein n=1 Tax=Cacopsylla melanoneura TaxID=428564 RepID=A0A8D9F7G4_9HEMI
MAANNYFGFTHSGTPQYTPTPGAAAAAAYQAQGGYAVAPTGASTPAATYTTQRAATGYDYSAGTTAYAAPAAASATTYDYSGYARSAATAYDTSKTYYQQPVASAASYTTTDYSGWTQASTAQKPTPAVSAVYTYSQPSQRSTQPAVQKTPGIQASTQPGYSTQSYGAPGAAASATNTYGTSAYNQGTNKFTSGGAASTGGSQIKKPVIGGSYSTGGAGGLGYTPSTGAGYMSSQSSGGGVTSSYSTYSSGTGTNKMATSSGTTGTGVTVGGQKTGMTGGVRTNVGSSTGSSTYSSSYDQALYNAALYNANQSGGGGNTPGAGGQNNKPQWKNYNNKNTTGTGATNTFNKFQRPKQPPKPQQIHYCEVCRISCAGPLTYKEHLEGSRHKKKEQAQKATSGEGAEKAVTGGRGALHSPRGTVYKCDLCSVTCTGTDAYSAHLRGVKHQKVVKLHQKLGKPIPEPDPKATAILRAKAEAAEAAKAATAAGGTAGPDKVTAAPKINFVASGALSSTKKTTESRAASEKSSEDVDMVVEDNILPVGQEFVKEIKTDDGKLQTFHCTLCDCKFNDPNAKDMHMKGKRHRLAYKKKVDSSLVVEIKPNYFQKQKEQRERMRADYARRREEERVNFWTDKLMEHEERRYWEEIRRYEEELEYYEWNVARRMGPHAMPMGPPMMPPRPGPGGPRGMLPPPVPPVMLRGPRAETYDDRHVIAKHDAILPKPDELASLNQAVDSVEKALKNVSDLLVEEVIKAEEAKTGGGVKTEAGAATPAAAADEKKKDNLKSLKEKEEKRVLKGVNRVCALAKNILIQGEMSAELIVLCAEKPTLTLLKKVIKQLPGQLKAVAPNDTFDVTIKPDEAGFLVTRQKKAAAAVESTSDPATVATSGDSNGVATSSDVLINVVLTSPVIREEMLEKLAAEAAARAALEAKAKAEADAKKAAAEGGDKATPTPAVVKQEPKETPKPAKAKPEPKDLLSAQKCLDALASLRHAKWFQAKAEQLDSCVLIIRLLRHMGQAWNLINPWALELLVEKVLASAQMPLGPGDALRRVLEAVACGLLLESGPGLLDPCEKEPRDALMNMPAQDREDVTVAAQIALRQMAFHQIHKMLNMEQLKSKRGFGGRAATRKRRRDTSSGEKEGIKKDKKEGEEEDGKEIAEVKMETK